MNLSPSIARVALVPLIGAMFALPAAASGADLYVATDGSGNCATPASACQLADAVAGAASNDRILLGPGAHAPASWVQDQAGVTGVTIMATPGEARPVLDLSAGTLKLTHGTSLVGVDIVASSSRAIYAIGGTLDHLRVAVNGTYAIGLELGDGAVLRNSTVVASGTESVGVTITAESAPAELRGATILSSGTDAVALKVLPDLPATAAKVRAVNTILRHTGNAFELLASAWGGQTASVDLDHVASDPAAQIIEGPGTEVVSRSAVTASPLFIDRANGDLRQTATSPTIDMGTPDIDDDGDVDGGDEAAAGGHDLDGSARRLGLPDIGADEREMPPLVEHVTPTFSEATASVSLTVQPRGLVSDIAADWGWGETGWVTTTAVQASGNDPVEVTIPLGTVPVGEATLRVKARVSNSAGTLLTPASFFTVPVAARPTPAVDVDPLGGSGTDQSLGKPGGDDAAAPAAPASPAFPRPALVLPGARPDLMATAASQARGMFAFRLRCRHTVSCRGTVLLTRIGAVRTHTFKIPPGDVRTVHLSLTSDQAARVRKAGKRGLRALLEVRSLDDGSTWTAVRLFSSRFG